MTKSILTTGDSVGGYRVAGIPDGLGAFDKGDGTFTVLMNHEIPANLGVVRAHGARGAFVSKWVVDSDTLDVTHGEDLIKRLFRSVGGFDAQNHRASLDPELVKGGQLLVLQIPPGKPVR